MVCNLDDPDRLAFPLRRGLVWRRRVSELRTEGAGQDLLPGIASLFNGALFRASTVEAVGVPDLRLFVRGDEVELHRRLVRSGSAVRNLFERGLSAPLRNRRVQADPGRPDAHPVPRQRDQEVLHLPQSRLPAVPAGTTQAAAAGVVAVRLVLPGVPPGPEGSRRVGSAAQAGQAGKVREAMTFTDAAAQSRTMSRARRDLVDGFAPPRAVAAPGLAGHQAALPAVGARAVLDHHRHRRHRGRDGRAVLEAVQARAVRAPAVRHARA